MDFFPVKLDVVAKCCRNPPMRTNDYVPDEYTEILGSKRPTLHNPRARSSMARLSNASGTKWMEPSGVSVGHYTEWRGSWLSGSVRRPNCCCHGRQGPSGYAQKH